MIYLTLQNVANKHQAIITNTLQALAATTAQKWGIHKTIYRVPQKK